MIIIAIYHYFYNVLFFFLLLLLLLLLVNILSVLFTCIYVFQADGEWFGLSTRTCSPPVGGTDRTQTAGEIRHDRDRDVTEQQLAGGQGAR